MRTHLDYGDIWYDKPNNDNFQNKMEKVQYRACLGITVVGYKECLENNLMMN